MSKKISVIIPCYNAQDDIDRCMASVVSQTIGIENLEVILVDDASTDGTKEKLFEWEKKYPDSVIVVLCEKNGRAGTARNIGMSYASAPYITFVDQDDYLVWEAYEKMYGKAEEYQTDETRCRIAWELPDNKFYSPKCAGVAGKGDAFLLIDSLQKRHELVKFNTNEASWGRLYRRDFLEKNEITFPNHLFYEDIYFSATLRYVVERMYVLDDYLYCYNRTKSTTATAKNESYLFDLLQVHLMLVDELCRRGYEKEFYQEIYGNFLYGYYVLSLELFIAEFEVLPYEVLNEMKKTVLTLYPDYKNSYFYSNFSSLQRGLLESLEMEMTNERWDLLAQNYRYVTKNAKNTQ